MRFGEFMVWVQRIGIALDDPGRLDGILLDKRFDSK